MVDPFVILAPILVLGVMALVRFVGCLTMPTPPEPGGVAIAAIVSRTAGR